MSKLLWRGFESLGLTYWDLRGCEIQGVEPLTLKVEIDSVFRSFFTNAPLYTTDMAFVVTIASVAGFRDTPVGKPSL